MNKIFFNKVNKKFDGFYLEFNPPATKQLFASLTITLLEEMEKEDIIKVIENLTEEYFIKYPLSIMTSSFDKYGDLIYLDEQKEKTHYTIANTKNGILRSWELLKDEIFVDGMLTNQVLKNIYYDIDYKTSESIEIDLNKKYKGIRLFKRLVIFWAVFVPLIVAVLEFYSPQWIAVLVLLYSFWKAYREYNKITGKRVLTKREKEIEEKKSEMEHFYYHCKKNPEKFLELKCENFKKESEEEISKKYKSL